MLTAGVSIAFFVVGKFGDRFLPNLFQFWTGCMFFMYFVLGCKLRQGELGWVRRIPLAVLVILDICLFGVEQIFPQGKIAIGYLMVLRLLVRVCLSVIGSLTAFLLLQYIATKINWKQCRWFMFLKKYSYAIYLFHHSFIFFSIVWFNGIFNPYVHSLINFAVSMIISIVLAVVFSKSEFGRMLIGMK